MNTKILPLLLLPALLCLAASAEELVFPPSPRLAITPPELAAAKARDDFESVRQRAIAAGDRLLANPPVLSDQWGNWIFYYACPDDGGWLKALSPTEHQCTVCKKIYSDERTIASYQTVLHNNANKAAEALGWAYLYSGDAKYAAGVQRILLHYADVYHTFPSRADRWGRTGILFARLGGRRYSQSLVEGVGIIDMAKAYDLTRDAPVWTDAQRKHVEQDFFRATADSLLRVNLGINNHQTWINAGLLSIASVLGDADLFDTVMTMSGGGGVYEQLQKSIGDDGFWYEGTMAYHFYALSAMMDIVDTCRRVGIPLDQNPRFRSMFDMPLQYAYPNGQFPAINDSDRSFLRSFRQHYLWAYQRWGDEKYAQAYAAGDAKLLANLLGPQVKVTDLVPHDSVNLAATGLVILRRGGGDAALCAMMDYGPHGGGHGHMDKLNLNFYAFGREWLFDPGRFTYSHETYKTFYKHTAAHNTIAIDAGDQRAHTGELLWFKREKNYDAAAATTSLAYPGVTLTRYLLLTDRMLVDLVQVDAEKPVLIDWFARAMGDDVLPRSADAKPAPPLGDRDGYPYLTDLHRSDPANDRYVFTATENKNALRLPVVFNDVPDQQIFLGKSLGYSAGVKEPLIVRRIPSEKAALLASVYDASPGGDDVQSVRVVRDKNLVRVFVTTAEGVWHVTFSPDAVTCHRVDPLGD